ncbi:flavin reductase family protein [Okibacterium endophyticum]
MSATARPAVTPLPGTIDAHRDSRAFRDALGRYPTGVAIVAASTPGGHVGMAVNSFTSVSLTPPLIAFCAMRSSTSWAGIRPGGRFAVSVLQAHHEPVARLFSQRGIDRFAGSTWRSSPSGQPVLEDALSWFDATIETVADAGDHELVVARVDSCSEPGDGEPLVFFSGRYGNVAPYESAR